MREKIENADAERLASGRESMNQILAELSFDRDWSREKLKIIPKCARKLKIQLDEN